MQTTVSFRELVELAPDIVPSSPISCGLFDVDSPRSRVSARWPQVMAPVFMKRQSRRTGDTDAPVRQLMTGDRLEACPATVALAS